MYCDRRSAAPRSDRTFAITMVISVVTVTAIDMMIIITCCMCFVSSSSSSSSIIMIIIICVKELCIMIGGAPPPRSDRTSALVKSQRFGLAVALCL